MKTRSILLAGGAAVTLAASCAWATAGEAGKSARYQGDQTARTVCMAIVADDVQTLDRALHQKSNYYSQRSVHESYQCNRLPLNEFAFTQTAIEVSTYLAPLYGTGTVTIERVGSIND
jgi:hypothetical protein